MSKPVKTIRVLRAARKLVANEATWTQDALARCAYGQSVCSSHPAAVSWCASGAIRATAFSLGLTQEDVWPLFASLSVIVQRKFKRRIGLVYVNDRFGRLAALSVIDAAIAELAAK